MAMQVADEVVRSERPSITALKQSLAAINKTSDPDEWAELMMLAVELFADGECRCEEKAATFGDEAQQTKVCNLAIKATHEEMLEAFRGMARKMMS